MTVSKDKPQDSAEEFFPARKSLKAFREAAADCKACDLWDRGTQTVFGDGAHEIRLIKPKVIVCLGATAAQTLQGPKFLVSKQRGQFLKSTLAPYIMATVHPSSILRAPDDETRHVEKRRFVNDLKKLVHVLKK